MKFSKEEQEALRIIAGSVISETKQKLENQARELGLLDPAGGDNSQKKPELKLPADNRQISVFAREVGEIIGNSRTLFRRDLVPVTINEEKKRLDPMTGQHFRGWAERHITFYKERIHDSTPVRTIRSMNSDIANAVLESRDFLSQLPEIKRLNPTQQPICRGNGSIDLLKPGFFEERGIYTLDDGIVYDLEMSGAQGVEILRDCFKEYPLDKRSLAAQIAAMLTTYCAGMITDGSRPPCFIYTANAPRAGKSMLAKFPNIVLFGSAAIRTLPRYDEARKILDIIALQGDSYAIFDNIRGKIHGEEIEAFLAAGVWEARPLGESTKYRVENNCVVFFTGNQLERSQDMSDRALFIELVVQEADSSDRKFTRVINDAWVAENRSKICSALWAIIREWDAAGRPIPQNPRLMGGFETWSKIVPPIVSHAGFGDCLEKPHISGMSDETEDMRSLVKTLAPAPDQREAKYEFEDLIQKVKELGLFETEEVRGGRRDADLFEKDGSLTRCGMSLFGKLFARWHLRKFVIETSKFQFRTVGRGVSRHYLISRID